MIKNNKNKFYYYLFNKNKLKRENKNQGFAFSSPDRNKINALKLIPISFVSNTF